MKEGFGEQAKDGENKKEEKGITRRDFLKKAAIVGGAMVAAGGIGKYLEEEQTPNEEIGEIINKKFIPSKKIYGRWQGDTEPYYRVLVKTTRGEARIKVPKEEFDNYSIGEKVKVEFKKHSFLPGEDQIRESLTKKKTRHQIYCKD